MNDGEIIDIIEDTTKNNAISKYLYLFIKRSFDIIFAIIGCIFLIPLIIIVKISYMLSGDFSSIFYNHDRIGKNGKIFKFYKFRSMVPNADEVLKEMLKNLELKKEYKKNMKLDKDPRVTKIGNILRKTSLDEMPQFINVLIGNMSLIGNRPYMPREIDDMGKYYENIVKTKPGITGYWQVSGRSNISFENRLKLEEYYSNNCSLLLDLKIFFKTFSVVLFGRGAK